MQQHATTEVIQDQSEIFAFLADPATHGLSCPVVRIDTHAAAVFLCGPDAYKVKRAVKFPFMDLSTLERRLAACDAEVAINSRYAPELYLGVVPITRQGGRLRLGGDGPVVEWAVHLRRFDETQTLDHVAERGELGADLIATIVEVVLATYATAEVKDSERATASLGQSVEETVTALTTMAGIFPAARAASLASHMRSAFEAVRPLLLSRGSNGLVRRCHGDLHLRNIVLLDGRPTVFDAIEFDEDLATTDILYDFAFLLMDVWVRGLRPQANLLLNRYLWGSPGLIEELEGLAALPLFLSLRAAIRAKVLGLRCLQVQNPDQLRREAFHYFDAAEAFLAPVPLALIAVGGLSGTGKTTLAARIAPAIGRAPGAVHLRSDIERKRLFSARESERLPPTAYRPDISHTVYRSLRRQADLALRAGHSVVIDAVHLKPTERLESAGIAERYGAHFVGLWLDAPVPVLINRVSSRAGDASDATPEIVVSQAKQPIEEIDWHRLDASQSIDGLAAVALGLVKQQSQHRCKAGST